MISGSGSQHIRRTRALRRTIAGSGAIVVALVGSVVPAENWPHWRGAGRNGVTREQSGFVAGEWRLRELWSANVGRGCSSLLLAGGRA